MRLLSLCRLWDGESGACVSCLEEHQQPVYSVAFSPDGLHLASGSFDSVLHVWRVSDGVRVRTYTGNGGIFEVGCMAISNTTTSLRAPVPFFPLLQVPYSRILLHSICAICRSCL